VYGVQYDQTGIIEEPTLKDSTAVAIALRVLSRAVALLGFVLLPGIVASLGAAAPAEAAGGVALDTYFQGRVTALDGKTVTLLYDFRKPEQAGDWVDRVPYRVPRREGQGIKWFDQKLEIMGNAGARHKAEWMGDVVVTATFVPDMEKDFGGYLQPVTETEDFATFTFVETFFHAWDNQPGGTNSIIKFGAQWREGDSAESFIGFRYGPRKPPKKKPVRGEPIRASFGLKGRKLVFTLPEYEMKGPDAGKPLKRFYVGLYAINGRLLLDNIEITGRLATDWLEREKIELRTEQPIGAAADEGVDAETQALMDKHKEGKSLATAQLVELLKDESRSDAVRWAIVACLSAGPKKAVPTLIPLLYHEDVKVREYGIGIVKALLGKSYGYKAGGSPKSRSKAVQKLNDDLKNNPGLLED
jgi:hypothetical protein